MEFDDCFFTLFLLLQFNCGGNYFQRISKSSVRYRHFLSSEVFLKKKFISYIKT